MDQDIKLCKNCKFCKPDPTHFFFAGIFAFVGIFVGFLGFFALAKFPIISILIFGLSGVLFFIAYKIYESRYQFAACTREREYNFVTGKEILKYSSCRVERKYNCGIRAKYFEPK